MTNLEIVLLAIALSVDACVVSFSYGLTFNQNRLKNLLLLASFTGVFQGAMPCLGYFLTQYIKASIAPFADLIVCTIFVFLGIKFVKEAFDTKKQAPSCISIACLLLIGLATSIDAFSAGISLSLYGNKILLPAILIAAITFINSSLGFLLGEKCKYLPTRSMEVFAGLILIALGIKAII